MVRLLSALGLRSFAAIALIAAGPGAGSANQGNSGRAPGEELVLTIGSLAAYRVAGMRRVVRVTAEGTVRTAGFSRSKLLPFPGRPPADGMYEFAFTVVPPEQQEGSERLTPVDVAFDWYGAPDNAVGIRVRAAANVLEARILPPRREDLDLARLPGRRISMDPATARPGDLQPSDLPEPVLIVRQDEPRPTDTVPERLTLVVDADGVILEAFFG